MEILLYILLVLGILSAIVGVVFHNFALRDQNVKKDVYAGGLDEKEVLRRYYRSRQD